MSKFYYIYKDNLPSYESYELFDPNEDDWFAATKALNNKGVRPISTLFIKGKNRVNKGTEYVVSKDIEIYSPVVSVVTGTKYNVTVKRIVYE